MLIFRHDDVNQLSKVNAALSTLSLVFIMYFPGFPDYITGKIAQLKIRVKFFMVQPEDGHYKSFLSVLSYLATLRLVALLLINAASILYS